MQKKDVHTYIFFLTNISTYQLDIIMSSRITSEVLEEYISNGINLYELLDLQGPSVTEREVRRNYRKQALLYHPDKDPSDEARLKFELISRALEVLTTTDLKEEYDKKLAVITLERLRNENLSNNLRDLRLNLQRNEQKHRDTVALSKQRLLKLEMVRLDGVRRRALKEKSLIFGSKKKKTEYKLKYPPSSSSSPPLLKLKWKLKKEVPDMLSNGAVRQLMEIFGSIESISKFGNNNDDDGDNDGDDARYAYCLIQYKDFDAFYRALKHDYAKTSDIWDEIGLRKVSSLLRSVDLFNKRDNKDNQNGDEMCFEDYFDQVVNRMKNV